MLTGFAEKAIFTKLKTMYGQSLTATDYQSLALRRSVGEIAAYLKNETHFSQVLSSVKESMVAPGLSGGPAAPGPVSAVHPPVPVRRFPGGQKLLPVLHGVYRGGAAAGLPAVSQRRPVGSVRHRPARVSHPLPALPHPGADQSAHPGPGGGKAGGHPLRAPAALRPGTGGGADPQLRAKAVPVLLRRGVPAYRPNLFRQDPGSR